MYLSFTAFSIGALLVHFSAQPASALLFFTSICIFAASTIIVICVLTRYSPPYLKKIERICLAGQTPRYKCARAMIYAALALLVGVLYANWHVESHKRAQIDVSEGASDTLINARICSIPKDREYTQSVHVCAQQGRYLLSAPLGSFDVSAGATSLSATQSMCVRAKAKIIAPRSTYNPDSNNYERHLFFQRIIGIARAKQVDFVPCSRFDAFASHVTKLRWTVHTHLKRLLETFEHKGIFIALLLGHSADISVADAKTLRDSGTQHLMAISGLHVGLVCWGMYALLVRLRLQRFAVPVLASFGLVYIASVGFGPSAQRAYIMMLCALFVVLGRTPSAFGVAMLLALTIVLLIDPLAPLSQGFWFSFLAVGALLFIYRFIPHLKDQSLLVQLAVVQCYLTLLLTLVQAHFGLPVSWFSLIANLVSIPWVSFVVLPLSFVGLAISAVDAQLSVQIFNVLNEVSDALLAFLELSEGMASRPSLSEVFVGVAFLLAVVLAILCSVHRLLSAAVVVFLFAFLLTPVQRYDARELLERALMAGSSKQVHGLDTARRKYGATEGLGEVTIFDVGQGLSMAAVAASGSSKGLGGVSKVWLYDTGPSYSRYSSARAIIAPYLDRVGVRRLDGMIVSHGDADHAGDAAWISERYSPNAVLLGEPERWVGRMPLAARHCVAGQSLNLEGTGSMSVFSISVLWPLESSDGRTTGSGSSNNSNSSNNNSCVVRLELLGHVYLIMGDLEGNAERAFIKHYLAKHQSGMLRADVLVAGHHGASAATSMALLKNVQAKYVVFSAGYANRFGHPAHDVLDRVKRYGAAPLLTAEHGALRFRNHGGRLTVVSSRRYASDYWIAP